MLRTWFSHRANTLSVQTEILTLAVPLDWRALVLAVTPPRLSSFQHIVRYHVVDVAILHQQLHEYRY